ncbi:hypothetical protein MKW98_014192, partial [Papaver atlanticum]
NCDNAIIIEASHTIDSWHIIGKEISHRFFFASDFDIFVFEENKAFFFSSFGHKQIMISRGFKSFKETTIRLYPWWQSVNTVSISNNIDQGTWIEIKGVPFNLWNTKVFEAIGLKFGGLTEIHTYKNQSL